MSVRAARDDAELDIDTALLHALANPAVLARTISPGMVADGTVDLRCPEPVTRNGYCHPGKLLAKLRLSGLRPSFVQPDNVIEMPCDECRYRLRRNGRKVRKVLHRYDLLGTCTGTLVDEDDS